MTTLLYLVSFDYANPDSYLRVYVLSPINDPVIIAESFIFEILDKNMTPR